MREPPLTSDAGVLKIQTRIVAANEAECPSGGQAVESGADTNRNGVLDDGEVAKRTVICTDPPPRPAPWASRVDAEPPGMHCAEGGSAVRSGRDANGNGKLEDGEVESTEYVCEAPVRTRMAVEPPGPNCVGGGIAFLSGRDRNGDQALEDSEVERTEYECSEVLSRDVHVYKSADLAALAKIRMIAGSLIVSYFGDPEASLPKLEHIGGDLVVVQNPKLETLSLPSLVVVDGGLTLRDNWSLTTLHLEKLWRAKHLTVSDNSRITDLTGLSSCRVSGEVLIADNSALKKAGYAGHGARSFSLYRNQLLESYDLSSDDIERVKIFENASMTSLDISSTEAIGSVYVSRNPYLDSATFYSKTIQSLEVEANGALTKLSVSTNHVEGITEIHAPSLREANFEPLEFGGTLEFLGAFTLFAPVETLRFGTPSSKTIANDVSIIGTNIAALNLRTADEIRGSLRLVGNSRLTEASFSGIKGSIEISNNNALRRLYFINSSHFAGDLTISSNDALTLVDGLKDVPRFEGNVIVTNNPSFSEIWFHAATEIQGNLVITNNTSLRSLGLLRLMNVAGSVSLKGNGVQGWVGLASLETVSGAMEISAHPFATYLSMSLLRRVGGDLNIRENSALYRVELPALTYAGGMQITNNPRLPACLATELLTHAAGSKLQTGNNEAAVCP